uniref:Uncharacterized protein n=1 Tax=Rhizophora mucronata TaxID=61149 RepID=A0A2P2NR97_RHIMU
MAIASVSKGASRPENAFVYRRDIKLSLKIQC